MELKGQQGELQVTLGKGVKLTLNHGVAIGDQLITTPGEFEIGGIAIEGIHDPAGTVFHLFGEDLAIASLQQVTGALSEKTLEALEDVDVVVVPCQEGGTIPPAEAAKLISILEPSLAVLFPAEKSTAEKNFPKAEAIDQLKVTKKDLPEEGTRVVLLS